MKYIIHMWRCNILLLLLLGCGCYAWAQNVAFIASPSASRMGIKDRIQFSLTIKNVNDLRELRPTSWGDFQRVDGPFQSNSFQNINGVQSVAVTLTYVIVPTHEGKLTIPPAYAKDAAGHVYQSNPVTVEVVPGSLAPPQQARRRTQSPFGDDDEDPFVAVQKQLQQLQQMQQAQMQRMQQMQQQMMQRGGGQQQAAPQQGQGQPRQDEPAAYGEAELKKDAFVRVVVDKSKAHVGEQITANYKLYTRIPIQAGLTGLPDLNGFWVQYFDIPQPKPTEEVVDGKKYQVFLIKKLALFPQQSGALELDPVEIKGVARIVQQVRRSAADMMGFGTLMMSDPVFNNTYFNTTAFRDVNVVLKNPPVKITVLPMPDKGKPEDYGGAVGKFTIAGKVDKKELTTDDVATFTLNISGSGNFKLIASPKFTLPNGLNTYDPIVVDTITGRSTTISGSKILTYAITPQTPGDYEIPAIPFSYFDPQSGAYVTLHTDPIKLTVKPGKHYNPTHTAGNNPVALKDIHNNASGDIPSFRAAGRSYIQTPTYWSLYLLPVLAFTGMMVWRKKNEDLDGDSPLLRHKKANKIALKRLAAAKKLLVENQKVPFYEEISKAIWLYLSDKLRIPLSSLSKETAAAALTRRNVPEHLQTRFESVIYDCETALYATGGSNQMAQTYDAAVKVISDLEGVI